MLLPTHRMHVATMALLATGLPASLYPVVLSWWWGLVWAELALLIADGLMLLIPPMEASDSPLRMWHRRSPGNG